MSALAPVKSQDEARCQDSPEELRSPLVGVRSHSLILEYARKNVRSLKSISGALRMLRMLHASR